MTEEQIEKLEKDAELAQRREKAERQMAQVQPAWRIKEQQALKDYYGRMNDAHERRMRQHHNDVQSNPNAYAPSERAAAERYFQQKRDDEIRHEGYEQAEEERQTRQYIADAEKEGKIGAGSIAAQFAAEAEKHKSNNTLAGIEKQIKSQEEIEKGRLEFEKWKAGEGFKYGEEASKREHGFWDDKGEYHPGSRERTGMAAAESRMTLESQRQDGREKLQKMRGAQRLESEQMKQLFGIAGKILNKDGKYKMKDAEMEAEKLGISPEALRSYFKQMGVTQDEEQKQHETAAVTPRASAIRINRFA